MSKKGRIQNIVIDRSFLDHSNVKHVIIDFGISEEKSAPPFTLELSLESDALYLNLFNERGGVKFRVGDNDSELGQVIEALSSMFSSSVID